MTAVPRASVDEVERMATLCNKDDAHMSERQVLDHAILGLLTRGPLTGYDLKKKFDGSIYLFWTADQSQIYRVLARLAEEGFVTFEPVPQPGKPNRKVYQITPEGTNELTRWLVSGEARSLRIRSAFLVQLYFSGRLPDDVVVHSLRGDLKQARAELASLENMAEEARTQAGPAPSREHFFRYMTVDYGLWLTRAFIDWAEGTIERIERGDLESGAWEEAFPPFRCRQRSRTEADGGTSSV
jgi:PadR family transcriptional regulator AphA